MRDLGVTPAEPDDPAYHRGPKPTPDASDQEILDYLGWTETPLDDEIYHRGQWIQLPLPTQKSTPTSTTPDQKVREQAADAE